MQSPDATASQAGRSKAAPERAVCVAIVGVVAFAAACGDGEATTGAPPSDAGPPVVAADAGDTGHDAATVSAADGAVDAGGGPGGQEASFVLRFIGDAYTLYASVGGGAPHAVQIDTGSIGIYVPAAILGPAAQVSATETCSITYVSSGNTLSGHTATAPITLLGSTKGGDVAPAPTTVPMPLCAVDDPTFKGGMMGVGFGRGTKPDPSQNPLLRIAEIEAGTMHAGYVLSTHPSPSVRIGLTATTAAGFAMLPLAPHPTVAGDWLSTSLRGCLTLPGHAAFAEACGPLLIDTGIAACLLWGPSDPTLGGVIPKGSTDVPAGTSVRIASPSPGSSLDYAFVTGTGAHSPAAVTVRTAGGFSINTGRAILVDDDYLFDAVAGRVGFRRMIP